MAFRRRRAMGATAIAVLMLGAGIWAIGDAAQYSIGDPNDWNRWNMIVYLGNVLIPAALFVYVRRITGRDSWLISRNIYLLAVEPVLVLITVATNSSHKLFYTSHQVAFNGTFYEHVTSHNVLFWAHAAYSYTLILVSLLILVAALLRGARTFRGQSLASLVALALPWAGNILYLFRLSPWPYLDLTPFLFSISGMILLWSLLRLQLFELSPVARDRLVEVMTDAVLVIDRQERIVDLNPAFEQLTGFQPDEVIGRRAGEIIKGLREPLTQPHKNGIVEIQAEFKGRLHYLNMKISHLFRSDNRLLGRVIVLRDVTEQKLLYQNEQEQRKMAEALAQSTQVLSSTLETETILDYLLELLHTLIPYDSAGVILIEDGKARLIRSVGHERFGLDLQRDADQVVFDLEKTNNLSLMSVQKRPYFIADTHKDPQWIIKPASRYIRSWMGAPLVVRGEVIGFFSLDHAQPGFYNAEHARRLGVFAGQAALSMENARLYAESVEALERERQLNEMTRIISSSLDLDETLTLIVRHACGLIGADAGALALRGRTPEEMYIPTNYNLPGCAPSTSFTRDDGLAWRIFDTGEPVITNDYPALAGARQSWVEVGMQGFLGVPVTAGAERLGSLALFKLKSSPPFKPRDLAMIEAVARQAGIIIQNTSLFKAAQRRADEAETLRAAAAAVTSALDLDQVLDSILVQLQKVIPYDSATIFLLEGDLLRSVAGRGFSHPEQVLQFTYPADNPLFLAACANGGGLVLQDANQDPRFQRWGDSLHVHGWMGLPIHSRGKIIGLLTIDSRELGAYDHADAAMAQALADETGAAIENARLFAEVQRLAVTDPLTGLYNRRHFFDLARREFDRIQRYQGNLALIMVDVDDLKLVNDTYGHLVGDALVEELGRLCQQVLRSTDILARYGGDEFIVLLPETDLDGAQAVARRMCQLITSSPIDTPHGPLHPSTSIGVANLTPDCASLDVLIERADQALYHSKRSGKSQVTIWKPQTSGRPIVE